MGKKDFLTGIRFFFIMTLILGGIYPAIIMLLGKAAFPLQASGSIVYRGSVPAGSALIGQSFTEQNLFQCRPSASDYFAVPSSATNLALTNKILRDSLTNRALRLGVDIADAPPDLLFSSGSGLDPHISPEAAILQARRIAGLLNVNITEISELIKRRTEKPQLGFLGEKRVNVFLLNCDIEKIVDSINR